MNRIIGISKVEKYYPSHPDSLVYSRLVYNIFLSFEILLSLENIHYIVPYLMPHICVPFITLHYNWDPFIILEYGQC